MPSAKVQMLPNAPETKMDPTPPPPPLPLLQRIGAPPISSVSPITECAQNGHSFVKRKRQGSGKSRNAGRINSRRCDSLHNGTHRWGRMMYGGMGLIPDISFDADTFNRIRGARGPK
ncbi:hypothetical protein AXG93_4773s1660 [Marchantia polymorpha subsp. ruderalis]|uniref:Uncharacterized protein n=1 Tax=Marchantia polymorpha subsp. ruderalis TaxID=1480154 RepID=A0A176WLK8_MARPO|nr:hypothetical protein AXG93_4773s1660 [Marchantia polymorpha subsp. ruderalis]